MNSPAAYRSRQQVTAIRWTGPGDCESVHALIGWPHPDNLECSIGDDLSIEPGSWIVRIGPGQCRVLTDDEFHARFEAVPVPAERPPLREVTQRFFLGDPSGIPGDCVRAAVASLLDREPTSV